MNGTVALMLALFGVDAVGAGSAAGPRAAPSSGRGHGFEFVGTITHQGQTLLRLRDAESGTTGWLRVGDVLSGYTVAAYDADALSVMLVHGPIAIMVKFSTPTAAPSGISAMPGLDLAVRQIRDLPADGVRQRR